MTPPILEKNQKFGMKRSRQTSFSKKAVCSGTIEIEVIGTDNFVVKQFGPQDAVFEKDASSVDLAIYFRPALTRTEAERTHVNVMYVGKHTTQNNHLFGRTLVSRTRGGNEQKLQLGEELSYTVYETHQLKWSPNGQLVEAFYITIENNLVVQNTQNTLQLETHIDLKPTFLKGLFHDRITLLEWFPPDVEPAAHGLKIDPSKIPQRTPLWFKLRGPVSGSKAYILLGFYVPRKSDPGGANYSFFKGDVFSSFAKVAMRLGTISEDGALVLYLSYNPGVHFYEMGWCQAPKGYPIGWGASPDGLIVNRDMSWDQVPETIKKHYSKEERNAIDITRGAFEIKTTRNQLRMKGYFIPQVYMEMIALNVVWCDLIRYRPSRVYDPVRKIHTVQNTAHVYRIWRHKPTETMLMKLWTHAYTNASKLQEVVFEEEYVAARAYFDGMAEKMPIRAELSTVDNVDVEKRFLDMDAYKAALLTTTLGPETSAMEQGELLLKEANERMAVINKTDYKRHKNDFIKLLSDQIQVCAELIKHIGS